MGNKEKTIRRSLYTFIRPVLFFVPFFLYVWLYIKPDYIYQNIGTLLYPSPFYTGWAFLSKFLLFPGGPVDYTARFLSQCYYFPWLGAMIITLIAFSLWWCTDRLITAVGATPPKIISYIPPLLLLTMYNHYGHPLTTCLALSAALWVSVLYQTISPRNISLRIVVFLILFIFLYYIAGGASLLFAVLAVIIEIFLQKRLLLGPTYFVSALVIPWLVSIFSPTLLITDTYLNSLPFHPQMNLFTKTTAQCLYFFIPLAILATTLWQNLLKNKITSSQATDPEKKLSIAGRILIYVISLNNKNIMQLIVLIIIAAGGIFISLDRMRRSTFEMMYFSSRKMWPELLELARRTPIEHYNFYWNHKVNRALYHTKKLSSDMFSFPQNPYSLMLISGSEDISYLRRDMVSIICLELGDLNFAEQMDSEIFENRGRYPQLLRRLAMVNIAQGQIEAARVYLNILSRDLIHGNKAKKLLQQLEYDPQLNQNKQIQQMRSVMWKTDYSMINYGEEFLLTQLLDTNPKNRMAFEYLMSYYILTHQLDKFVANLVNLKHFTFNQLPRHYQEAILGYMGTTGIKPDTQGHSLDSQLIQKFNTFARTSNSLQANKEQAFNTLAPDYGTTYFFYSSFGISGVTK